MEEYFSCTKCGSNDFMPVVRMQGRGNYSLSSPVSNWAGSEMFRLWYFS